MMLSDKVAVVYGAGGGIGGAVSRAFAREGAKAFITGRHLEPVEIVASAKPAPKEAHTSAELFEKITGTAVDSPLCMTCGTKMRPAGSCYVCEGCGSTSGCS